MEINVLAELDQLGVHYDPADENEVKLCCPFHGDDTPSCFVNFRKRVFKCHAAGCERSGDFVTLTAGLMRVERHVAAAYFAKKYGLANVKTVDPQVVERWHEAIWSAAGMLEELHKRAVTDDDIRQYRLGFNEGRITIPIKNEHGQIINVRRYLPGAPGPEKMKNARGFGSMSLFPVEQLQYDRVMICGGEMKAVVAARQLNPHGVGAVCATAGEGNWSQGLIDKLTGKYVFVCLDIDEAGRKAAVQRCTQLRRQAVPHLVTLPLDEGQYPKGDINDFVAAGGDLWPLVEAAEEFTPDAPQADDGPALEVSLNEAVNASMALKRVRVQAVVSAMDTTPYIIPKDVRVVCSRNERACCPFCPVYSDDRIREVPPESPAVLAMVAASKAAQDDALKDAFAIPKPCRSCAFDVHTFHNVEDTRVSPQLAISNRTADRVMLPAVCIGQGLELNEHYHLTGRLLPHPKSQQSTLLISGYQTAQDALGSFKLEDPAALELFRPRAWSVEAIGEKLDEVYEDLEANVTRIFRRRDIHLWADLTYHSPLVLPFDGKQVKGWVETLIMGNSSQGKSETVMNLMLHYGLGEKVECKNASVAGLLGGLQQVGTRWFVSWGVIPTHDRRLVVLEELKGTSTDVIGSLTDMRSSGVAQLSKIEKRRTHARTRIVAISNPRSDYPIESYNFGVEAVKELIGGLEDVRRFDAVLIVGSNEISARDLNTLQRHRPEVAHQYTSELCRQLVLWGWTVRPEEISLGKPTFERCLDRAIGMCERFSEAIPIVDQGSMKLKLARLAAALAVRTFSHEDGRLVVRPCHVDFVADALTRVYSSKVFGYEDFTRAIKITNTLVDAEAVEERIKRTPYPRDFVDHMLHKNFIDVTDLADWTGEEDRSRAQALMSFLVRKHALLRSGRAYHKTEPFIELLKRLQGKVETEYRDF